MGQEIKMQGALQASIDQMGLIKPETLTITPQVVKTAEGERTMWPANPFWFGIEISTRKKRTRYETEDQKMLLNVSSGVKEGGPKSRRSTRWTTKHS